MAHKGQGKNSDERDEACTQTPEEPSGGRGDAPRVVHPADWLIEECEFNKGEKQSRISLCLKLIIDNFYDMEEEKVLGGHRKRGQKIT